MACVGDPSEGRLPMKAGLPEGTTVPAQAGRVTAVRGSVVEVAFPDALPPLNNALRVHLGDRDVILEVALHLDIQTVRAISMAHVEGLARGMPVEDTGNQIMVPVGPPTLGRLFDVLGDPLDGLPPLVDVERWPIHRDAPPLTMQKRGAEFLETGIKVLDLLAPLARGGKAG